jgi:hypothetical protein
MDLRDLVYTKIGRWGGREEFRSSKVQEFRGLREDKTNAESAEKRARE